jgi:hypothetical protein
VFLVPPDLAGLVRALHDDCLRSASEKARQSSTQDPHCQSRKGNTRRPWGGEGDTMRRSGGEGEPSLRVSNPFRGGDAFASEARPRGSFQLQPLPTTRD